MFLYKQKQLTTALPGLPENSSHLAVATLPALVPKLEYRYHTVVWGVVTHAR